MSFCDTAVWLHWNKIKSTYLALISIKHITSRQGLKPLYQVKCWGYSINTSSINSGFPGGSEVKASACNVGDLGSIPRTGRSPGEGNGNPLQDSRLESPMDGGAWWATVHGVAKSRTRLSDFTFTFTLYLVVRSFQMVILNITSRGSILSTNNFSWNIQKDEEIQRFVLMF